MNHINSYSEGFRDGVSIGLGYLSVSFTFGMMAVESGLPVMAAIIISVTNVTSAGQFAGLALIIGGASYLELALTQLIINMRYALMSLSLSQKLHSSVSLVDKFIISYAITDEIFAVASAKKGEVGTKYMLGLITSSLIGWFVGTLTGAAASTLLPFSVRSALGIAIYGMFIAIIIPPAIHVKSIQKIIGFSVITSCILKWVPFFSFISSGFSIIICTVIASGLGAKLFPIEEEE